MEIGVDGFAAILPGVVRRSFTILREIAETRDSPFLQLIDVEGIVNGLHLASSNSGLANGDDIENPPDSRETRDSDLPVR
jgi:hypothetical protein